MDSPMIPDTLYPTINFWLDTPDGTMTVAFVEDKGKLIQIFVTIGKSGASIGAWCQLASDTITALLNKGGTVDYVMSLLSGITSDKNIRDINGVSCRSGPAGLYICFAKYRRHKYQELLDQLGFDPEDLPYARDDDDDEDEITG